MGKRIRLGLIYIWDSSWLGGVYYIQNLIKAINLLEERKKPIINVYCLNDKAYDDLYNCTRYPYLEKTVVKISLWKRVCRKLVRPFINEKADTINLININSKDDVIYPWSSGANIRMIDWVADFQSKHFPELFNKNVIKSRDDQVESCCIRGVPIIFSSKDSQDDFYRFFPNYKKHKTFVLHFATSQPDFSDMDIVALKTKYGIKKRYLFCANQFWQHKNHLFMFRAFKQAIDEGLDMQLVCTGKMIDFRCPQYIDELKSFITLNHLENEILTLGMIDKKELLCLMKNSHAVLQPSLFEGWNTTVEDCKAMNKFIFLSDIKVHREQINKNVCFFNPYNESDLVNKLLTIEPVEDYYDYSQNIKQFGEDFYHIIESSCMMT